MALFLFFAWRACAEYRMTLSSYGVFDVLSGAHGAAGILGADRQGMFELRWNRHSAIEWSRGFFAVGPLDFLACQLASSPVLRRLSAWPLSIRLCRWATGVLLCRTCTECSLERVCHVKLKATRTRPEKAPGCGLQRKVRTDRRSREPCVLGPTPALAPEPSRSREQLLRASFASRPCA